MKFLRRLKGDATVRLTGGSAVHVVGESHYQDALGAAVGGKSTEGAHFELEATLRREPNNPYDANAVAVLVAGDLVGYLSREDAVRYADVLKGLDEHGQSAVCSALITGGWKRGPDEGHFGITLDLAAPEDCLNPSGAPTVTGAAVDGSFDLAARAVELAGAGQASEAEELFGRALANAERAQDEEEQRYVEGRYADFLIRQERKGEAKTLLQKSIEAGSDLPATFDMLIALCEEQGEWSRAEELLRAEYDLGVAYATRAQREVPSAADALLALAHAAVKFHSREGVDRAIAWANQVSDPSVLHAARHALGALAEENDDIAGAIVEYQQLAQEGSRFEPTHTRLMILLEKERRYTDALTSVQRALALGGSAAFEQGARRRMARLEQKTAPRGHKPAKTAVPPFLHRGGAEALQWIGESKVTGGVSALAEADAGIVGLGIGKGAALWDLPEPPGSAIAIRPARSHGHLACSTSHVLVEIGDRQDDAAHFVVLDAPGFAQLAEIRLPDRVTQIGRAGWGFALGCRDGGLYVFDAQGAAITKQHLRARTGDDEYTRPVPYHVACASAVRRVLYSSYQTVHCVGDDGKEAWQWALPEQKERIGEPDDGITIEFSLGDALIRALVATSDGGGFLLGNERIWRLDHKGDAKEIAKGPEQPARLTLGGSDQLVALSSWGLLQFFARDALQPAFDAASFPEVRWSESLQILAAYAGVNLWLHDRRGALLSHYEFTKSINDVIWQGAKLVVAAAQAQFFRVSPAHV